MAREMVDLHEEWAEIDAAQAKEAVAKDLKRPAVAKKKVVAA